MPTNTRRRYCDTFHRPELSMARRSTAWACWKIGMAQQAIDLWTQAHGPGYFLLSNGYLLRAQALAHAGDSERAIRDAQHALAIVEAAIGRDTVDFLSAQVAYARILRSSGAKQEGSRMAKEAGSALADLERRQCSGCTIDASGFR
jgi:hypothetical protein